jgi:hypothetical protein
MMQNILSFSFSVSPEILLQPELPLAKADGFEQG